MRRRRVWFAAVWPLVLVAAFVFPVHGQEGTTSISGYVVNGTAGADAPGDVRMLLHAFRGDEQPELRSTTADSTGRFVFEEIPLRGITGYNIVATHQGISYSVDLTPDDDLDNVRLTVYETTTSLDDVVVETDSLLVLDAEPSTRTLSLMEMIQIANTGDRAFTPGSIQDGGMEFLRFPLPPGATNLKVQSDLPQGQMLQVDRGFALSSPVPPGEYGLLLTYTVPYTGARLDVSRVFLRGVGLFRVLMPEKIGRISSTSLREGEDMVIGGVTYRSQETMGIPPAGFVEVSLEGLPQQSLMERVSRRLDALPWTAVVPVALAAALGGLLIVGLRRKRAPEPVAAEGLEQGRASLMRAIAALDDRFQRGELEELAYREERQALKMRLVQQGWQEESKP